MTYTYSQLAQLLTEYADSKEAWDEPVPFKDSIGNSYEVTDALGLNQDTGVITLEKADQ